MNVHTQANQLSTRLVEIALTIKLIVEDGLDEGDGPALEEAGERLLDESVEADAVGLGIEMAKQALTVGVEGTPNRHLRAKIIDLAEVRAKRKAEESYELPTAS